MGCQETHDGLSDHVLVLIKFNIFRAIVNNATTLGFQIEITMEDDALSPFTRKSTQKIYFNSN